jgi:hypothetical protein
MTLPQYSEAGTWKLDYISVYDEVGNRRRLSYDDASNLGFPTTFQNEKQMPSAKGRIARWQRPQRKIQ